MSLSLPIPVPENTPFGPSSYPSGTNAFEEYPSDNVPKQQCHAANGDTGNYSWSRQIGCYIALPTATFDDGWTSKTTEFFPVDSSVCVNYNQGNTGRVGLNTFPAYLPTGGTPYLYNGYAAAVNGTGNAYPVDQWAYPTKVPNCQAAYSVNQWQGRTPI